MWSGGMREHKTKAVWAPCKERPIFRAASLEQEQAVESYPYVIDIKIYVATVATMVVASVRRRDNNREQAGSPCKAVLGAALRTVAEHATGCDVG